MEKSIIFIKGLGGINAEHMHRYIRDSESPVFISLPANAEIIVFDAGDIQIGKTEDGIVIYDMKDEVMEKE